MSAKTDIKRIDQRPMHEAVLSKNKSRFLGLSLDQVIHYFFFGHAWVAFVVLVLITFSLFNEGWQFFPQQQENLRIYRQAGLEFVEIMKDQVDAQSALVNFLDHVRSERGKVLKQQGLSDEQIEEKLSIIGETRNSFDESGTLLRDFVQELVQKASGIKDRWTVSRENAVSREQLLKAGMKDEAAAIEVEQVDLGKESTAIVGQLPRYKEINGELKARLESLLATLPVSEDPVVSQSLGKFKVAVEKYINGMPEAEKRLDAWRSDKPVEFYESLVKFLFGPQWVTQSSWQDFYGFVPLLVGSLSISVVALVVAVPLGIGAAIYINQVATIHEQNIIKPYIEFIAVIPSVVLGFFGIAILGEAIRVFSGWSWVSWVPFFPISERLNIITAGILLALMAVPSIFTFSEDALNNVPKAYKEASFALGANRLQTILRIMIPASLSGIISAVLLGFGRVIGETMVVLMCAGNRIAIPDFTQGLGFVFQPVHTMTGLVAQEIPEVARGSLQYRALFMLAIMLFLISLFINYVAQIFVRKFKISVG